MKKPISTVTVPAGAPIRAGEVVNIVDGKAMPALCGCMTCHGMRAAEVRSNTPEEKDDPLGIRFFSETSGFRYACEICGNKRCPHHSDHRLACTNSNEPGQPGSFFT